MTSTPAAVVSTLNELDVDGAGLVITSWLEDRGLTATRAALHERRDPAALQRWALGLGRHVGDQ